MGLFESRKSEQEKPLNQIIHSRIAMLTSKKTVLS